MMPVASPGADVSPDLLGGEYKYKAFLSYAHTDLKVAATIQRQLEAFVIPTALRARKPGARLNRRPLSPVFRDADELVPGSGLSHRLQRSLRESEFLIIVCSPASARSPWVNLETEEFVALGRGDQILCVVIDGEPNAVDHGFDRARECLPDELRRADSEPLWVDWRPQARRERRNFLRLVASLLALPSLDALIQRDRRRRQTQAALTACLFTVLLAGGLAALLSISGLRRQEVVARGQRLAAAAMQALQRGDVSSASRLAVSSVALRKDESLADDDVAFTVLRTVLFSGLISRVHVDEPGYEDLGFTPGGDKVTAFYYDDADQFDMNLKKVGGWKTTPLPHDISAFLASRSGTSLFVDRGPAPEPEYTAVVSRGGSVASGRVRLGALPTAKAISPDGLSIALGFANGSVILVDAASGDKIGGRQVGSSVSSIELNNQAKVLVVGKRDGSIEIFRGGKTDQLGCTPPCGNAQEPASSLLLIRDHILLSTHGDQIEQTDISSNDVGLYNGFLSAHFDADGTEFVSLRLSSDETTLLARDSQGRVYVSRLDGIAEGALVAGDLQRLLPSLDVDGPLALSPGGGRIVEAGKRGLSLWSTSPIASDQQDTAPSGIGMLSFKGRQLVITTESDPEPANDVLRAHFAKLREMPEYSPLPESVRRTTVRGVHLDKEDNSGGVTLWVGPYKIANVGPSSALRDGNAVAAALSRDASLVAVGYASHKVRVFQTDDLALTPLGAAVKVCETILRFPDADAQTRGSPQASDIGPVKDDCRSLRAIRRPLVMLNKDLS